MKLKFEVEMDVDTDADEKQLKDELVDYIQVGLEDFSPSDTECENFEVNDAVVTSK